MRTLAPNPQAPPFVSIFQEQEQLRAVRNPAIVRG